MRMRKNGMNITLNKFYVEDSLLFSFYLESQPWPFWLGLDSFFITPSLILPKSVQHANQASMLCRVEPPNKYIKRKRE